MNLIVTTLILQFFAWSHALSSTEESSPNKTKRTITHQVQNYAENRPVILYQANSAASVPPQPFYAPLKAVFESEVPKQAAGQQVLYEFQQTPPNAVSNVPANQYYQPVQSRFEQTPSPVASSAQYVTSAGNVATPVQHSSLVRHGQNFAQVQVHPMPHHVHTQQYLPGKYVYVNGKVIYQPNQQQPQKVPPYFAYQHPQIHTQKFLTPPPLVRPMGYRRFNPPQPQQLQQITKPVDVPQVVEEQTDEEPRKETEIKKKENEEEIEEEEEDEEKEVDDEEEENDHERYFNRYNFDDDDDDHHYGEDDDEDEDNERGSSKTIPKKQKKKTNKSKYNKRNNYKYGENYSSSSRYEKQPNKKVKKNGGKSPKMHYKSVKYSKEGSSKPRNEKLEGKQSQNVPVVHKQKIFKEKWYVTKSTDDSIL